MSEPLLEPLKTSAGASMLALFTAGGTLVCCVLPAVMVALGAGAALAGLVSAVPQLIWLSEHKLAVFAAAGIALAASGFLLRRARHAPCPTYPHLARTCARLRVFSNWTWGIALVATMFGALFAFGLPLLMA